MYLCVQYEQSQNASQFERYRSLGPCRHGHIAMINKQRSLNWISCHTNRFWRQAIAGADWDYKGHMTTVKKYLSSWETTLSVNCRATRYTRLFFALLLLRLRKTIFDSTYNQLQAEKLKNIYGCKKTTQAKEDRVLPFPGSVVPLRLQNLSRTRDQFISVRINNVVLAFLFLANLNWETGNWNGWFFSAKRANLWRSLLVSAEVGSNSYQAKGWNFECLPFDDLVVVDGLLSNCRLNLYTWIVKNKFIIKQCKLIFNRRRMA